MSTNAITGLLDALTGGTVRVVDLSVPLGPATPLIKLPPEMAQFPPVRIEQISNFDPACEFAYCNAIHVPEHAGTHFDAPNHWISGRNYGDGGTHTIPVRRFIGRACVIDKSVEAGRDEDYLLTRADLLAWEARYGRIPAGAWVLLRTDWSKRTSPEAFLNMREDGAHTPGPAPDAINFIAKERDAAGFGCETVGTDAGQSFKFDPPLPAHTIMHGNNKYGVSGLANLDQLPATGALFIAAPLKIVGGSGSPIRALAVVPA